MKRTQFGSLNSRALFIDRAAPLEFKRYVPLPVGDWCLSISLLMNPLIWLRVWRNRSDWRFEWQHFPGCNNRCYCDCGRSCSLTIELAGFYLRIWYSHFDSEIPCPCDIALDSINENITEHAQ